MKTRHLIIAALISVAPLIAPAADDKPAAEKKSAVKNVGVEEFDKLRAKKENVVLDVRREDEFKAGHIPGAINIDVNAPDFAEKVAKLDKSKTYLVHCAAGKRSATACKKLEGMQFKELYNLEPGLQRVAEGGQAGRKVICRQHPAGESK
jgi:rhodanese-related sulfurtransferase